MDNQHKLIKGYRDLAQADIDLMNKIKTHAEATKALIAEVGDHVVAQFVATEQRDEVDRLVAAEPYRWQQIAVEHMQQGLMALTRAVAQPTTF